MKDCRNVNGLMPSTLNFLFLSKKISTKPWVTLLWGWMPSIHGILFKVDCRSSALPKRKYHVYFWAFWHRKIQVFYCLQEKSFIYENISRWFRLGCEAVRVWSRHHLLFQRNEVQFFSIAIRPATWMANGHPRLWSTKFDFLGKSEAWVIILLHAFAITYMFQLGWLCQHQARSSNLVTRCILLSALSVSLRRCETLMDSFVAGKVLHDFDAVTTTGYAWYICDAKYNFKVITCKMMIPIRLDCCNTNFWYAWQCICETNLRRLVMVCRFMYMLTHIHLIKDCI